MGLNCKSRFIDFKTYPFCCSAFAFALLGCLTLIIAVSTPFWLVSKSGPGVSSDFVRLGLWSVCFKRYYHPNFDKEHYFDGCYSMHSHKSEEMRNWLQPGWFILVQCLVSIATTLAFLCICLLIYMLFQVEMEIKIFVAAFVFVFEAISALLTLLGVCIFGVMSFERIWITDPKQSALSWSFGFCVIAATFLSLTAVCLLIQTLKLRKVLFRDNRAYHIPLSNRSMPY